MELGPGISGCRAPGVLQLVLASWWVGLDPRVADWGALVLALAYWWVGPRSRWSEGWCCPAGVWPGSCHSRLLGCSAWSLCLPTGGWGKAQGFLAGMRTGSGASVGSLVGRDGSQYFWLQGLGGPGAGVGLLVAELVLKTAGWGGEDVWKFVSACWWVELDPEVAD